MNLEKLLRKLGIEYEEAINRGYIIEDCKNECWGLSPSLQFLLKDWYSKPAKLARKEIQDKHSKFGNPAKKIALDLYKEYINQNFGRGQRKTELNILCLPGIHFIERSAYLPLENRINKIIGVERDEQIYDILEKCKQRRTLPKNVELHQGDVSKFIKEKPLTFHIAFLDFTGYFQKTYYNIISKLFQQDMLEDQGILGLTILCGREQEKTKQTFTNHIVFPYFYLNQIFKRKGEHCGEEEYDKIRDEIYKKFDDPEFFKNYRIKALPIMMGIWGLTKGEPSFSMEKKRVYVPEDGKVIMYFEGKRGNPLELVLIRYTKKDLDPDRAYEISKNWIKNPNLEYKEVKLSNNNK